MKVFLTVTAVAAILSRPFVAASNDGCPPGTVPSTGPVECKPGEAPNKVKDGCWNCSLCKKSCPNGYNKENGICCPISWNFPPTPEKCDDGQELKHDSSGCWKCWCPKDHHESSGHCCPDGEHWSPGLPNASAKPGSCCQQGHSFTVSKDGQYSTCCPTGYANENGKCVPPVPNPSPEHPCSATQDNCTTCAACAYKPICPDVAAKTLGIDYGKCYVLELSSGKTVGRYPGGEYEAPGYYTDLPFKVCDKDHDCKKTGPVGVKDIFTLWDVIGGEAWINGLLLGARGFFSRTSGHEVITADPNYIATFVGKPSCLDGKYGICVGGLEKGAGPACPAEPVRFNMNYPNSKMCQRFMFKPITCPDTADDFILE